jgi:hypothetical protein
MNKKAWSEIVELLRKHFDDTRHTRIHVLKYSECHHWVQLDGFRHLHLDTGVDEDPSVRVTLYNLQESTCGEHWYFYDLQVCIETIEHIMQDFSVKKLDGIRQYLYVKSAESTL